jgi:hypothetical protein
VDCGFVTETGDVLRLTPALEDLLDGTVDEAEAILCIRATERLQKDSQFGPTGSVATAKDCVAELIPDAARREEALLALSARFDDSYRRMIGEIGEEAVLRFAREELEELGYPSLARAVRRVSLQSDQLGYDISAPRLSGAPRLLEVKAIIAASSDPFSIHLTRNEADTGVRFVDWSLVVCNIVDVDRREGEILGWCSLETLKGLLPTDSQSGQWDQATISLGSDSLIPGLPRPT